ncbi:uncharacterized protein LOC111001494 [Pieris rapae]|uniref:uncharacterized protein LOC111001494 n=1 Tax=Pieris rapae TaxID=64459 RepID=UPI001E27DE02|nr:uncharacterized protein LOC111001494 [Pieris rapae]
MFMKWRALVVLWLVAVAAEDTPEVSKDEHDLVAEASQKSPQAQNREGLSNSYGEPLPPDAYGPPRDINSIPDSPLPAPVYGVPETIFLDTPPGAYGPPAPVVFPNQNYEGPPPPIKPKPIYGPPKFHPPKISYGPPKPVYGPPKKSYGPPKHSLPKINYGTPFKPPKISYPKPGYGAPKPIYGPPKPVYGPPKVTYGTPLDVQNVQFPLPQSFGTIGIGANVGSTFSTVETSIGTNFGSVDLPAPIYGTPFPNLPVNLKPNFPVPSDSYGPPGLPLGSIGQNDQLVVQDFGSIGHYGPPQPDPNPRPPHPGIPAPPTPPHVLYDGWRPIPGVSKPLNENLDHSVNIQSHIELDQYGPPPPPPPVIQSLEVQSLPNIQSVPQFSGAQISSGYSTVHQDALSNIDLNAIVGGDSNHIDQSKTVFEAHYTEKNPQDVSFIQNLQNLKPIDAYGPPEPLSFPVSIRQQGAKGLIPPSGVYGVPPGSQYGVPPRPLPSNLPIPYGSVSGGGHSLHTGGNGPRHPIKFRESVPEGLIQQIGQISQHKDHHSTDHLKVGPAYLPPPVREVKDINHQTGNFGVNNLALSIEPTNLYSLPHAGNPVNFQVQPSNLYGSPVDSYSVPLHTVGDHTASGSSTNAVTASLDGNILANLSNLEAAAILKHCPYHEAILKAAQSGEKIPADLASKYVASLSSLGATLLKNKQVLLSPQNAFNTPARGAESVSYNSKDLSTASHSLVQTILPSNHIDSEKTVRSTVQKGKSLDEKQLFKQNSIQSVSDQIYETSEKIKNLSEETKQLQQKIVTSSQSLNHDTFNIPIDSNSPSFSVQIQSSQGKGKPTIPHEQLLSEGLLQSILQAIEQPQRPNQQINQKQVFQIQNYQPNINQDGLVLPAGYEPIDRTKSKDLDTQSSNKVQIKSDHTECDLRTDNSIRHEIVVPPPPGVSLDKVDDVDNDVAIYFDQKERETVTEITVATSISEDKNEKKS